MGWARECGADPPSGSGAQQSTDACSPAQHVVRSRRRAAAIADARLGVPSAAENDGALLARMVRGDTSAHRSFFDRHHAGVTSFLRLRLRDPGLCDEITSDVFFDVWRGASSYRGEAPVSSWLLGIARLKLLSAHRARGSRNALIPTAPEVIERTAGEDPEASLAAREELRRLLRLLSLLPERQRDVVTLAFLEQHSYEEIAQLLGISEATVKMRVHRARARLRDLMRGAA